MRAWLQIWEGSLHDVLAVEPSAAMANLGQRIQAARHSSSSGAAGPPPSLRRQVRWVHRLPWQQIQASGRGTRRNTRLVEDPQPSYVTVMSKIAWSEDCCTGYVMLMASVPDILRSRSRTMPCRASAGSRQYDIVTSAYVFGEIESEEERAHMVQALWASTKHLLILVEPGTPNGYANVLDARRQVFTLVRVEHSVVSHVAEIYTIYSHRQIPALWLLLQGHSWHQSGVHSWYACANVCKSLAQLTSDRAWVVLRYVKVLEASMASEGGGLAAHVLSPCPHDGVCPMERTGSWCHFAQRFRRSNLQRITKIRPDGGLARTYQVHCCSCSDLHCSRLSSLVSQAPEISSSVLHNGPAVMFMFMCTSTGKGILQHCISLYCLINAHTNCSYKNDACRTSDTPTW